MESKIAIIFYLNHFAIFARVKNNSNHPYGSERMGEIKENYYQISAF